MPINFAAIMQKCKPAGQTCTPVEESPEEPGERNVVADTDRPPGRDPRPDLEEDSAPWERLLALAEARGSRAYEVLHGFRCLGTRIEVKDGKHRLVPLVDPQRGWASEADYREMREKWLKPLGDEITALLQAMDEETQRAPTASGQHKSTWGKCQLCGAPMWVGTEPGGICKACELKASAGSS